MVFQVYKVAMASNDALSNYVSGAEPALNANRMEDEDYRIPVKKTYRLNPIEQLYRLTLGTARQLNLHPFIGNFAVGKEADFLILDLRPSPLHDRRLSAFIEQNSPDDLQVFFHFLAFFFW
jgi:cytosine/adenosine deaminase-related metal-dependent hydrolase